MRIHIRTIPHIEQRYPTVGDYWESDGVEEVRISQMSDWRYEILVTIHELIEMAITRHRGIPEQAITEFDIQFETERESGEVTGEPGDHPNAPYRREHLFATNIERLFAAELNVDWLQYEKVVDSLGIKR
jgi:hypothetical protein